MVTCVVQLMLSVGQSVRLVSLNCDLDTIYLCTVTVVAKVAMTSSFILQAYVHKSVMEELKRIIDDSEITKEDDALWPPPDRVGRQVCLSLYGRMGQGHFISVQLSL